MSNLLSLYGIDPNQISSGGRNMLAQGEGQWPYGAPGGSAVDERRTDLNPELYDRLYATAKSGILNAASLYQMFDKPNGLGPPSARSPETWPQRGTPDAKLSPFEPSSADVLGGLVADGQGGLRDKLAEGLFGSRGLGPTGHPSIGGASGFNSAAEAGHDLAEGAYGRALLHGGDAALNATMFTRAVPEATRVAAGGTIGNLARGTEMFAQPFNTAKGTGEITGSVLDGTHGVISGAFGPAAKRGFSFSRLTTDEAKPGDVLRAVRALREQYPYLENVTATRIPNKYGNPRREMNIDLTPEWKKIEQGLPWFMQP